MASIINASTTSTSGLVQTADASGVLQLQSNGVTGLTVGPGGVLTAANGMVFSSMTLGTAQTGEFEYDGKVPYFTPAGTQRGVIPGMQYYRLNSAVVGANAATSQSALGVGVTVSASTVYEFKGRYYLTRTAGTTSHVVGTTFGGTATGNNILYRAAMKYNTTAISLAATSDVYTAYSFGFNSVLGLITTSGATVYIVVDVEGTISINAGGTIIPQYNLSAAPGGAYTSGIGSYFAIWPVGAAGSNVSVGSWA